MKSTKVRSIEERSKRVQKFSNMGRDFSEWSIRYIGHSGFYISRARYYHDHDQDVIGFSVRLFRACGKDNLKVVGLRFLTKKRIGNIDIGNRKLSKIGRWY